MFGPDVCSKHAPRRLAALRRCGLSMSGRDIRARLGDLCRTPAPKSPNCRRFQPGTQVAVSRSMPSINSLVPPISWGPDAHHQRLAKSHARRLAPRLKDEDWEAALQEEIICRRMERELVERERAALAHETRNVPTDPGAFATWFEN